MVINKIFSRSYILASKSLRRIKLLDQLGLDFISIESNVSEIENGNISPLDMVKHNAQSKGTAVATTLKNIIENNFDDNLNDRIIISADTIVSLENKILNKPADQSQAKEYLKMLSNNMHIVYTGFNLIDLKSGKSFFDFETTKVFFRKLGEDEIDFYVKNYSPFDKAGAYGIQDDFGCLFVEKIDGDYYNVVGLPLTKLYISINKLLSTPV